MNLRPAPWEQIPNTIQELKEFMQSKEFTVISPNYHGATTTTKELKEHGIMHAQILYGKDLNKTWYGEI